MDQGRAGRRATWYSSIGGRPGPLRNTGMTTRHASSARPARRRTFGRRPYVGNRRPYAGCLPRGPASVNGGVRFPSDAAGEPYDESWPVEADPQLLRTVRADVWRTCSVGRTDHNSFRRNCSARRRAAGTGCRTLVVVEFQDISLISRCRRSASTASSSLPRDAFPPTCRMRPPCSGPTRAHRPLASFIDLPRSDIDLAARTLAGALSALHGDEHNTWRR